MTIGEIGYGTTVPQPADSPVATGLVYAPDPLTRRRYLVVVEACPWCTRMHLAWRWVVPSGLIRRRCPTWGRRYWIAPQLVHQPGRRRKAVMAHVRRAA